MFGNSLQFLKTSCGIASIQLSRNNQQNATLYYNLLFYRSLEAQHVSSGILLIIRSSNFICSLLFAYACGDRP